MEESKTTDAPGIPTAGIPIIYANNAQSLVGYNDIRVYFGEIFPRELVLLPPGTSGQVTSTTQLRVCLVFSPEFARALHKALGRSVEQYEEQFGKLRAEPPQPPKIGPVEEIKE